MFAGYRKLKMMKMLTRQERGRKESVLSLRSSHSSIESLAQPNIEWFFAHQTGASLLFSIILVLSS